MPAQALKTLIARLRSATSSPSALNPVIGVNANHDDVLHQKQSHGNACIQLLHRTLLVEQLDDHHGC